MLIPPLLVLDFNITLASGSDFYATNDTWVAGSNKFCSANQVNGVDSTSNNFWITAVQLEVGEYTSSTLPVFPTRLSYGDNLARCQRYFNISLEMLQMYLSVWLHSIQLLPLM